MWTDPSRIQRDKFNSIEGARLIETCKSNGIDPEAYLRDDVLTRIAEHPINRIAVFLPWHWTDRASQAKAA